MQIKNLHPSQGPTMFDPETAKIKLTWKTTVATTINTHGNNNVIVSLPGV
jgi:hypothetical protein